MTTRIVRHAALQFARLIVLVLAALALPSAGAQTASANFQPSLSRHLPMETAAFTPRRQFTSQGQVLEFQVGGFYLSNGSYALRVEFLDARPVTPTSDASSTDDSSGLLPLKEVRYVNLWDGITLTYDASRGLLTSSYRVEPRADVGAVHLRYNAPVTLGNDGTLAIAYVTGQMVESAPMAWQEVAGARVPVDVAFQLRGERDIGFAVGAYDASRPLFIDPTLTWNTFLGGNGDDIAFAVALDSNGNLYVAGLSDATWGSPVRAFAGGHDDAFVAKLNSNGELLWNTFLGGNGDEFASALAADSSGNLYVAGSSTATWGSPVRGHTSSAYSDLDGFAAKLNSAGALMWNTFLGGGGQDEVDSIAVDNNGAVYILGGGNATWGSPLQNAAGDASFLAKLNASSGGLLWNTFLTWGDEVYERRPWGIAVGIDGNVYIAGSSGATWGSPVREFSSGSDAFVAKMSAAGALIWNTFLGGPGTDHAREITVDGNGNVYVAGTSSASWESPVEPFLLPSDVFAAKLSSGGTLIWNTFVGANGVDAVSDVYGMAVDANGNVYLTGNGTNSRGAPAGPVQPNVDAYAAKLGANGALTMNNFFGCSPHGDAYSFAPDWGYGIAVDGIGNVYVAGFSSCPWGSPVRAYSGDYDAFVGQIGAFDPVLPVIIK